MRAIFHGAFLIAALSCVASCSFDASANRKHGCSNTCKTCMVGFCLSEGKGSADAGGKAGTGGSTDGGSSTGPGSTGTGSADGGMGGAPDAGTDGGAKEPCTEDSFCFDGTPREAATMGSCKAGTKHCENGVYGSCLGQVIPTDEQCNGLDDDCDNKTDEDVATGSCTADNVQGECKAGALSCENGVTHCRTMTMPAVETCNGLDDDCDGMTDEGTSTVCYPSPGQGCVQAMDGSWSCTGACKVGAKTCSAGKLGDCEGWKTPAPASDDGCTTSGTAADDDCDGMIDEECSCTNGQTQNCYRGPDGTLGVGTCASGTQMCANNKFGGCTGGVTPVDETCTNPGADNNCNGTVDDVPSVGNPCDTGKLGVCKPGTLQCQGASSDTPSCVMQVAKSTEVCDELDNDCNGTVDDHFDLKSDHANCGKCGTTCSASETCCNGACKDTSSDNGNCGTCANSCGSGNGCCDSQCVGLQTNANCGSCGTACTGGSTCCTTDCVDLTMDPNNCGACGHICTGGTTCCSGACVKLSSSNSNCGQCGKSCGAMCSCMNGTCKGLLGGLCVL